MSIASLCIPRVTSHYSVETVESVFNQLFGGDYVDHIDMKMTEDSQKNVFQVMFIHFKDTPGNDRTQAFYSRMEEDHMVKVWTNGSKKWYWKVFLNKGKKIEEGAQMMTKEEELEMAANRNKTV